MDRPTALAQLRFLLGHHRVVTLVGPRQVGKTTLSLQLKKSKLASRGFWRFDLEDPIDIERLQNPRLALEETDGLVIIDEVQRRPQLFPILRVLVDRGPKSRRFLILGSASGELLRQSSESLAGRTAFMELAPFAPSEASDLDRLWVRGGFPRAYLARSQVEASSWLDAYVTTFLERDVPSFGLRVAPPALRRFWMMLAHVHGQTVNQSELGRAMGVSQKTILNYIDILQSTFMIRVLQPWFENIEKRQVKSPKLYFRDSGLFHALLGVRSKEEIVRHPKLGASWEGFALECVLRELRVDAASAFFWASHSHAEIDLMIVRGGRRFGFEFKWSDAPRVTQSMRIARDDLTLEHLYVVFPGEGEFPLDDRISGLGLATVTSPKWARRFG